MSNNQFNIRVALLLSDAGITQKELAATLGINPQTFNGYMTAYRTIPLATVIKVADHFGVTTDYLLGRSDTPRP